MGTVGIYCRLSHEDESRIGESESIVNQKGMLAAYAQEKGWDIYDIYCDEDYSGADRNRPGFCDLIADAEQGKFDIVLCKTQSRFTRDMELLEHIVHNKFVRWGIRFVAALDNVDTDLKGNKKARQINGLINEWYLEDLSNNIRAVFDHKRKEGQYIGSFPIYGYQKDPANKHKLIIDYEAAQVVKRIFRLYLEGNGKQHIAYLLNEEKILNPTKYKQAKGLNYINGSVVNDHGLWNKTSVGRILRNIMYAGDLVQGVTRKLSYKSKTLIHLPKEEWIVIEDNHDPIIDKATFAKVQKMMDGKIKSSGTGQVHLLAGKVKCMDCGSVLHKMSNKYKGKNRSYLRCKLYNTDRALCSNHSIRLDELEHEVSSRLKQYLSQYYDASDTERLASEARHTDHAKMIEKEIKKLTYGIEKRDKAIRQLYLDKVSGELDEEQYGSMNRAFVEEKANLKNKLAQLETELNELGGRRDEDTIKTKIDRWLNFDELSRELIADFVDTIEISEKDKTTGEQTIQINWMI